ncbi:MAG: bifunctional phosphopantothenoylcysteine decarboxylase/phosphopantothenate--cysteine ligase CoaBC [Dissulfuribacterales bacterium]
MVEYLTKGLLEGRRLLLGLTGGIAVCKAVDYARRFKALGMKFSVVLTQNATRFVTPLSVSALTNSPVHLDIFEPGPSGAMAHITLAREAELFCILPATANTLAKIAHGIADDLLSTLCLSFGRPILIFPAMNPVMWQSAAVQANVQRLKDLGHVVISPAYGETACGECGEGRLPDWPVVREAVISSLTPQTLEGSRVLVSAGPTREPVDPVRFISNRSSGKMGYAIAQEAARRGANVILVSGPVAIEPPPNVEVVRVETAAQMQKAMERHARTARFIVMTAAVADYAPIFTAPQKLKKTSQTLQIELCRNPDILTGLCNVRTGNQFIVGFCAETENLHEHALQKFETKGVDMLVANDVSKRDAGFDVDTNRCLFLWRDKTNGETIIHELPLMSKEQIAMCFWDAIEDLAM